METTFSTALLACHRIHATEWGFYGGKTCKEQLILV